MYNFLELHKDSILQHHAYLISGDRELAVENLFSFFEKEMRLAVKGNPDFYYGEYDGLGIDESRALRDMAFKKAMSGGARFFVIAFNSITIEAQNALLKIFEEPPQNTHFFIITQSAEILLPTLRSRLMSISKKCDNKDNISLNLSKQFLSSKAVGRLVLIKEIIENKDKVAAIDFLNNLEAFLYKKNKLEKDNLFGFEEILKCRQYLRGRSASVKMILEHISIILPVF